MSVQYEVIDDVQGVKFVNGIAEEWTIISRNDIHLERPVEDGSVDSPKISKTPRLPNLHIGGGTHRALGLKPPHPPIFAPHNVSLINTLLE